MPDFILKRTTTSDKDFRGLIQLLDNELWNELNEDQATYDPFNKVDDIDTALVAYHKGEPLASGCFKKFDEDTVEVKRMFVKKKWRGKGISKMILGELEKWAMEQGYSFAVLETSIHFKVARGLYESNGYSVIPNYGQYKELPESVCMKKGLSRIHVS